MPFLLFFKLESLPSLGSPIVFPTQNIEIINPANFLFIWQLMMINGMLQRLMNLPVSVIKKKALIPLSQAQGFLDIVCIF